MLIMSVESLCGSYPFVRYILMVQDIMNGHEQDLDIQSHSEMIHIPYVIFKLLGMCDGISSVDLRPSCYSGAYLMPPMLLGSVKGEISNQ